MANPPPPYSDITGISRTVMKDNAQETLVNYNGNARPGEIVADLTQDPPTLYIGNNQGQLTLISTGGGGYGNTQVGQYLAAGLVGNIIPAGNGTHSLGNSTNWWSNLWVTGNTIFIGGVPLGITDNVLTVGGNAVLSNDSDTSISTTGNISADVVTASYFVGNGLYGNETNDTAVLGNASADVQVYAQNTGVGIQTYAGEESYNTWTFDNDGTLTTPGDITLGGDVTGTAGANTLILKAQPTTNTSIQLNSIVDSRIQTHANLAIITDASNTRQTWTFDSDGNLTLPGNTVSINYANGSPYGGGGGNASLPLANGTSNIDIATVNGNVTITAAGSETWTFDDGGNLTLPVNGSITVDGGDGAIGPVSDDLVISWDNEEIRLVSVQGSIEMQADNAFRVQTNYDGANVLYASRWEFSNNELVNISNNFGIVSEAGNLTLSGGRDGVNSGNTIISSVDLGNAVVNWNFGNNGVLTLPNGGEIDNDGNNIELRSANNINFEANSDLNIYTDDGNSQWTFGSGNTLTLPGGTAVIDSSDDNIELRSNNNINIETFNDVNIYTGDGAYQFYFSYNGGFVLPANGAIVGETANNNGYINWTGNSSGDGNGYTTLTLTPDSTITDQSLILDPTAPGHIHLRAPGIGGNIEQPTANLFVGPEDTNLEITANYDVEPLVRIRSGGEPWTFDRTGNLTVPGNILADGNTISLLTQENPVFNNSNWSTAVWSDAGGGQGNITFTDAQSSVFNTMEAYAGYINPRVIINGNITANIVAVPPGRDVILTIDQAPVSDPTGVDILQFIYEAGLLIDETSSYNGLAFGAAAFANINVGGKVYSFDSQGGLTVPAGITVGNVRSPRTEDGADFNSTDLTLETFAGGGVNGRGGNINLIAGGPTGNATQGGAIILGPINTTNIFIGGAPGFAARLTTTFAGNILANGDITLSNVDGIGGTLTGQLTVTTPLPLANLAAVAGGRAFVNDGNLAAANNFGAQIGSGGSNTVPVWSDGTNWYIG